MKAPRSLRSRALQLLAQRDQSRAELRRKLLAHARETARRASDATGAAEADPGSDDPPRVCPDAARGAPLEPDETGPADLMAEVDAVLDWLEASRFLSNERFAEGRINTRSARFGNLRIRQELARHELTLGPEAQQVLAASELERARAVRARKFAARPSTPAEQARQARFLSGRGFSPDVIRKVLRDAARGADETS